jgi:hypothetical protein
MNGVVIDKTLVPGNIQVKVPFYLFAQMDKQGGFRNSQILNPVKPGLYYLYSYTVGVGYNFLDFQIGNDVKELLKAGDLVHVYGDDSSLPNFLCHVVVTCDYQAYCSVLENTKDKCFYVAKTKYFTDNPYNFLENLTMIDMDNLGLYNNDKIQPTVGLDPYTIQDNFVDILTTYEITEKKGIASYMLFNTDLIQFQFEFSNIVSQFNNVNNGNNQSSAILFRVN